MSHREKPEASKVVTDLLRYAEDHEVDLFVLLLALSCHDGLAGDEVAADPVDVPAHYYPH